MKLIKTGMTLLITLLTGHAIACDFSGYQLATPANESPLTLGYKINQPPLAVDQHFSLQVLICDAETPVKNAKLRVDATMPAHRHGMNYRPTVTGPNNGVFQVDGLLFHMAGRWQLAFDVFIDQRKDQFVADQLL